MIIIYKNKETGIPEVRRTDDAAENQETGIGETVTLTVKTRKWCPDEAALETAVQGCFAGNSTLYLKMEKKKPGTTELLQNLNFDAGLQGFTYLVFAARLLRAHSGRKITLGGDVYPTVANAFHTTPGAVERSINYLIFRAKKNVTAKQLLWYLARSSEEDPSEP